jgi:hypothetical protein
LRFEEQTITDANTGVTISFRPSIGRSILNIKTRDGRSSDLMFGSDGSILSIVPNAFKELGVCLQRDPDSEPPIPPKGLTLAEATSIE